MFKSPIAKIQQKLQKTTAALSLIGKSVKEPTALTPRAPAAERAMQTFARREETNRSESKTATQTKPGQTMPSYGADSSPSSQTAVKPPNSYTDQKSSPDLRDMVLSAITQQKRDILSHEVSSGGKLPEGFRWHITGSKAYAVQNLATKPLTVATAAGQPALFGIDPSQYVKHMQAIDNFNAAAWRMDVPEKKRATLVADRNAALAALGADAEQYAGRKQADYYQSYVNHPGNAAAAQAYQDSYSAPWFQLQGSVNSKHNDRMTLFRMMDAGFAYNPVDLLETGESQLMQKISEENKNAYLSIADKYGKKAADDFWEVLKKDGAHGQNAYNLRDSAYRSLASEHPVLSSAATILTAPMGIAGTLYSIGQKISGQEIDPYADPFLFGQATSTIRQQVGAEITRNYGNEDGTDNLGSWLMRRGYDAMMAAGDSLVSGTFARGMLPASQKGAALLGSLMQGTGGAGNVIQDIKLRGGSDEQALMMGGLSTVFETATEFLPMDALLKAADAKDVVSFSALAKSAFKGGLAEAPGEGLSEALSSISDHLIMGELSNYEQAWRAYRAEGMSESAAKQKAVGDSLWHVFEASFTGFLSGEFSNTAAGMGSYLHSKTGMQPPGTLSPGKWQQWVPDAGTGLSPAAQESQQIIQQENERSAETVQKVKANHEQLLDLLERRTNERHAETVQKVMANGEQLLALLERRANERQAETVQKVMANGEQLLALLERRANERQAETVQKVMANGEQLLDLLERRANERQAKAGQETAANSEPDSVLPGQQADERQAETVQKVTASHEQLLALLERRANERQDKGVQGIATNGEPFSALQERQVADIRTKPVQRKGARLEQLVTSPLQQERIQPVQNLPALSPARQQAVQDSWQRAAQPLYQALRPQLEALQQIQDPAQRRITEAALERPFYLLWQEAARRQAAPVAEGLMQQEGERASRLLAEAAVARFYDLLWEEMKGRSAERGGMPGIALLESEARSGVADGDAEARREVEPGSLPEKGDGGVADEIAESDKPYPAETESLDKPEKSVTIKAGNTEVRKWYLDSVAHIPDSIDQSLPMIEKAHLAYEARNRIRTEARNRMADKKTREMLDRVHPNKTFEQLLKHKMEDKGLSIEEAIEDIYNTATKTNKNVNRELGLDDE